MSLFFYSFLYNDVLIRNACHYKLCAYVFLSSSNSHDCVKLILQKMFTQIFYLYFLFLSIFIQINTYTYIQCFLTTNNNPLSPSLWLVPCSRLWHLMHDQKQRKKKQENIRVSYMTQIEHKYIICIYFFCFLFVFVVRRG